MGGKPPVGGAPPTYRGRTQLGTQDVVVKSFVMVIQGIGLGAQERPQLVL